MKVLQRMPVYKKNGRSNLTHLIGKKGVYQIYDRRGNVVYVGSSTTNLYKVILRHFQKWGLTRFEKLQQAPHYHATFPKRGYSVKVWITTGPDSKALECILMAKKISLKNKNQPKAKLTAAQRQRVSNRLENAVSTSKNDQQAIDQRLRYNDKGELLDENGKVLF